MCHTNNENKKNTRSQRDQTKEMTDGFLTGSFTINDIPASDTSGYRVRELTTARYKHFDLTAINSVPWTINRQERLVWAELNHYENADISYKNRLANWNSWSHKDYKINLINVSKKE